MAAASTAEREWALRWRRCWDDWLGTIAQRDQEPAGIQAEKADGTKNGRAALSDTAALAILFEAVFWLYFWALFWDEQVAFFLARTSGFGGSLHVLWTIHNASQPGRLMTSRGWRIVTFYVILVGFVPRKTAPHHP